MKEKSRWKQGRRVILDQRQVRVRVRVREMNEDGEKKERGREKRKKKKEKKKRSEEKLSSTRQPERARERERQTSPILVNTDSTQLFLCSECRCARHQPISNRAVGSCWQGCPTSGVAGCYVTYMGANQRATSRSYSLAANSDPRALPEIPFIHSP